MLRFVVKLACVVAVSAVAVAVVRHLGAGDSDAWMAIPLAAFGAVAFFFGEYIEYLAAAGVVSHGARAKQSPLSAWRFLGVAMWAAAVLVLIFMRG